MSVTVTAEVANMAICKLLLVLMFIPHDCSLNNTSHLGLMCNKFLNDFHWRHMKYTANKINAKITEHITTDAICKPLSLIFYSHKIFKRLPPVVVHWP